MFSCAVLTRLIVSCSDFLPSFCRSQSGPRPLSLNLSPNSIKIKHRQPVHLLWHLGHKPAARQFYLLWLCPRPSAAHHRHTDLGSVEGLESVVVVRRRDTGTGRVGTPGAGHQCWTLAVAHHQAGMMRVRSDLEPGAQLGTCPGNWVTPLTATDHTTLHYSSSGQQQNCLCLHRNHRMLRCP